MKYYKQAVLLSFAYLIFFSCQPPANVQSNLNEEENLIKSISYLIDDPALANAQIGIYIESLKDNHLLFARNEYKLFVPASNQKLYTTASALENLGADYTYQTQFYTNAKIVSTVLDGDLIVRGMGDPSISGRFKDDDVIAYFNDWADSLKSKGISSISGNLIANDSYFSDSKLGFGWNWDDEPYWYSAQIAALSYNDNCVDLTFTAGDSINAAVKVVANPQTDYVKIINKALTTHADSLSTFGIWRKRGENIIELKGLMPAGTKSFTRSITVENPALWFIHTFASVLNSKGIQIRGELIVDNKPINTEKMNRLNLLFKHRSPDMAEMVKVVNKGSHNFYAEQLFKTLGAEKAKVGTASAASDVMMNWLNSIGITEQQVIPVDGSGLSRMNLVSPFSTAALLRHMYSSKNFDVFYESLPIAGVDGTLKNRMKNSSAAGVVRAKTGFVRYVRSLSGYTKDQAGNGYLFVIMVNHYSVPTPYINKLQDKICILLTNYNPQ